MCCFGGFDRRDLTAPTEDLCAATAENRAL